MAIFYTDSGSLRDLKVSGSTFISASAGIALQVRSSGSTIFSVSGSSGEIFNISDVGLSTALFTVASASTNILNVDSTKAVSVSGSLVVTGSAYIRGLGTTVQNNIVTIDTSTGQLYYTSSSALSVTIPTPTFIATGSVTASVNVGTGNIFALASASINIMTVSSSGATVISGSLTVISGSTEFQVLGTGVKMGNSAADIHTITGSLSVDSTLYVTQSKVGIFTGITAPASALQVNGGITVGQSGSNQNQAITFIRNDGFASDGLKSVGGGTIQVGGANINFVDIHTANEFTARFNNIIAGPNVPALNLRGPLFVSGSGYAGTVDYMTTITGSGVSGSLNVNNTLYVSSSYTILPQVSSSLNFANDTAAAAGGVPLGGLYRNGNVIQIRLV
jgi:hypothetical protein